MVNQQLTWVGSVVREFNIDALLGGGTFSWVYSGLHQDGKTRKAFKVAKPADLISEHATGWLPTKAMIQMTGAIAEIQPDTDDLLRVQAETLKKIKNPSLPQVEDFFSEPGLTWYRMPVMPGTTLRTRMQKGEPVSLNHIVAIVRALDKLSEDTTFRYHGDLKPENVMVSDAGEVTLLDPGYFGPLRNSKGTTTQSAVTTPAYYPSLLPDDLLAVGLMLWELASGEQPLRQTIYSEKLDTSQVSDDLIALIKAEEVTGKAYHSAILKLRPLSESKPGIAPELDKMLMKAVRLDVLPDGKLTRADGFRSFSAMAGALIALKLKGLKNLVDVS